MGRGAPAEAQLLAYRAAAWGAFAFGIIGEPICYLSVSLSYSMTGTILAAVFLRGVGIVGVRGNEPTKTKDIDSQGTVTERDENTV